jgi:hypothetical protein
LRGVKFIVCEFIPVLLFAKENGVSSGY